MGKPYACLKPVEKPITLSEGSQTRWYYDTKHNSCYCFRSDIISRHENNFASITECIDICVTEEQLIYPMSGFTYEDPETNTNTIKGLGQ